jgi:lysozyme family protein
MADFYAAIPHILKHEGGYASTPAGEVVNRGINTDTLIALGAFGGVKSKITPEQMEELKQRIKDMTEAEAVEIYKQHYWTLKKPNVPNALDQLHSQYVATKIMDMGVLAGTRTATKILQKCLGTTEDGTFGDGTIALTNQADPIKLVADICLEWSTRLTTLANKNITKAEEAKNDKLVSFWTLVRRNWNLRANWVPPIN